MVLFMNWTLNSVRIVFCVCLFPFCHSSWLDDMARSCRAELTSSVIRSHLPSFAEYCLWSLGVKENDSRRVAVWNAVTSYLFLRVSEQELVANLKTILKDVVGEAEEDVYAFLSDFRQRRSEYFAWNWDQMDGMTEVNRQDYLDWKENYYQTLVSNTKKEFDKLELTPTIWNHFVDHKYDVLVITTAPFCSWCRSLDHVLKQLVDLYGDNAGVRIFKLDASRYWDLAKSFHVRRLPEIDLWRNGKRISRYSLTAPKDVDSISKWMEAHGLVHSAEENLSKPSKKISWWKTSFTDVELSSLKKEMSELRRACSVKEAMRAMGCLSDDLKNCVTQRKRKDNEQPVLIFMGGGIASGKSSLLLALAESEFWKERGADIVCVEADRFKEVDPLFHKISELATSTDASRICHRESTNDAEELLLAALKENRDIVFDGTCKWRPFVEQTIEMVRNSHLHRYKRGYGYRGKDDEVYWIKDEKLEKPLKKYEIWLIGAYCAVNVSVGRSVRRAVIDGRGATKYELLRSHKLFSQNFEEYAKLVDKVILYDNTKSRPLSVPPPLIAQTDKSKLSILNEVAYQKFLKQQHLNVDAVCADHVYNLNYTPHEHESGASELEMHASPTNETLVKYFP